MGGGISAGKGVQGDGSEGRFEGGDNVLRIEGLYVLDEAVVMRMLV